MFLIAVDSKMLMILCLHLECHPDISYDKLHSCTLHILSSVHRCHRPLYMLPLLFLFPGRSKVSLSDQRPVFQQKQNICHFFQQRLTVDVLWAPFVNTAHLFFFEYPVDHKRQLLYNCFFHLFQNKSRRLHLDSKNWTKYHKVLLGILFLHFLTQQFEIRTSLIESDLTFHIILHLSF